MKKKYRNELFGLLFELNLRCLLLRLKKMSVKGDTEFIEKKSRSRQITKSLLLENPFYFRDDVFRG